MDHQFGQQVVFFSRRAPSPLQGALFITGDLGAVVAVEYRELVCCPIDADGHLTSIEAEVLLPAEVIPLTFAP